MSVDRKINNNFITGEFSVWIELYVQKKLKLKASVREVFNISKLVAEIAIVQTCLLSG
jgi:hypothetical protein